MLLSLNLAKLNIKSVHPAIFSTNPACGVATGACLKLYLPYLHLFFADNHSAFFSVA